MVLLLSYDLNRHERPSSYQAVYDVIEGNAVSFRHPLYSEWFVETGEGVEAWSDLIASVADEDDNWFVVGVTRPYQGWLPSDVWEWLSSKI